MLVALLASFVSVVGLIAQVGGSRVIRHVQHERCLTNIARLEVDLGLREPSRRIVRSAAEAASHWTDAMGRQAAYATTLMAAFKPDAESLVAAERKRAVAKARRDEERGWW